MSKSLLQILFKPDPEFDPFDVKMALADPESAFAIAYALEQAGHDVRIANLTGIELDTAQ